MDNKKLKKEEIFKEVIVALSEMIRQPTNLSTKLKS